MTNPQPPQPWSSLFRKRKAANLTLTQLAERTGYSVAQIGHVERGVRAATKPVRYALAAALGCTPADLDDDTTEDTTRLTLDILAAQHAELGEALAELRAQLSTVVAA